MEKGLLIVQACIRTGSLDRAALHDDICKQLENSNVVVLPIGWEVVYYPPGTEVIVDTKKEQTPVSTPKKEDKEEEIWCTECPYFKDIEDNWDRDWFGALCTKDGHESSPSMYAVQSLHDDCPLKKKEGEKKNDAFKC